MTLFRDGKPSKFKTYLLWSNRNTYKCDTNYFYGYITNVLYKHL